MARIFSTTSPVGGSLGVVWITTSESGKSLVDGGLDQIRYGFGVLERRVAVQRQPQVHKKVRSALPGPDALHPQDARNP